MPSKPSIKGSIFSRAIDDVQKLIERGEITRDGLSRWLEPGDLDYFERSISLTDWCCIRSYTRLLELLREVEGEGSNEYLRRRGSRSAEELLDAGLYQQLEYLNRTQVKKQTDPNARYDAFGRDLRLLTTVSSSILSFSRWSSMPDPDYANRYIIEISEASDFPDALGWSSEGFVNRMATQHGDPDLFAEFADIDPTAWVAGQCDDPLAVDMDGVGRFSRRLV